MVDEAQPQGLERSYRAPASPTSARQSTAAAHTLTCVFLKYNLAKPLRGRGVRQHRRMFTAKMRTSLSGSSEEPPYRGRPPRAYLVTLRWPRSASRCFHYVNSVSGLQRRCGERLWISEVMMTLRTLTDVSCSKCWQRMGMPSGKADNSRAVCRRRAGSSDRKLLHEFGKVQRGRASAELGLSAASCFSVL